MDDSELLDKADPETSEDASDLASLEFIDEQFWESFKTEGPLLRS